MTPEEFEKLKQAEKAHLQEIKQLKDRLRSLKRQNKIAETLKKMEDAPGDDILNTHEEMLGKLQQEIAEQEARFDLAMDASDIDVSIDDLEEMASRESLKKAEAKDLIRQIKIQMGLPADEILEKEAKQDDDSDVAAESDADAAEEVAEASDEAKSDPVEEQDETLPEKTIGRIKK